MVSGFTQIRQRAAFWIWYGARAHGALDDGGGACARMHTVSAHDQSLAAVVTNEPRNMHHSGLKVFTYKFDKGPVNKEVLQSDNFTEGNCRFAFQYYLFKIHDWFINPKRVLNPGAYKQLGKFVVPEGEWDADSIKFLKPGDIIYAERIRDKPKMFTRKDDWIKSLHSAVWVGINKKQVYHATVVEGRSCFWELAKFLEYYLPIAVKRFL